MVICDASVVVKWFVDEPGPETGAARQILLGHRYRAIDAAILDLTLYEVANALLDRQGSLSLLERAHDLMLSGLKLIAVDIGLLRAANAVATTHGLSYYDASYLAAGELTGSAIVSADRALIRAGAESPIEFCERLGLA